MTKLIYYSILRRMEQWKSQDKNFKTARYEELFALSAVLTVFVFLWSYPLFKPLIDWFNISEADYFERRGIAAILTLPIFGVNIITTRLFFWKRLAVMNEQFLTEGKVFTAKERKLAKWYRISLLVLMFSGIIRLPLMILI